jgi:hypothetical protein
MNKSEILLKSLSREQLLKCAKSGDGYRIGRRRTLTDNEIVAEIERREKADPHWRFKGR